MTFTERRPAQDLATHDLKLATVQVRFRFTSIPPIEHFALLQFPDAERDLNVGVSIGSAGF